MDDVLRLALRDGHVQRVEHDIGSQRGRHRPADDATAPRVEDDGDVQKACPRRHVRNVGNPKLVRTVDIEVAVDEVARLFFDDTSNRRLAFASTRDADDAVRPHDARDAVPSDTLVRLLLDEILEDADRTVRAVRRRVMTSDALEQLCVRHASLRRRPD